MKQFIGHKLEAAYNLNKNDDDKIQLITKGSKYDVFGLDYLGTSFVVSNDAGNFDVIHCSYFKIPDLAKLELVKENI